MIVAALQRRVHYAWVVAAVTFLALITSAGMRATPGVLIVPLQQEFGWSRATISVAISINLVLFGLCGPFSAALMDRFGMRKVMVVAMLTVAVAAFLTIFMHEPWQLYLLWGVVVGLTTGSTATVLAAMVANRWFIARRGLVTGILTAGNATGQLIFLPLLASLVVTFGWRSASIATAVALAVAAPIVFVFMRDRPEQIGLTPYGAPPDYVEPTRSGVNPARAAVNGLLLGVRSRDFWLLSGSFFICGATTNGLIGTHLIPASMDHGISEVTAAGMLAVMGIFDIVGTTISGWLSDRLDNRWLLCWYYSLRGLSLLFLPYALGSSHLSLAVFVVFYGLDWVATVPPTVRLAADIFGKKQVGVVFGWIFAAHQLGAATAASTAGVMRTILGSYQMTFLSAGLLCLVAAGLVIRISRPAPGRVAIASPVEPKVSLAS